MNLPDIKVRVTTESKANCKDQEFLEFFKSIKLEGLTQDHLRIILRDIIFIEKNDIIKNNKDYQKIDSLNCCEICNFMSDYLVIYYTSEAKGNRNGAIIELMYKILIEREKYSSKETINFIEDMFNVVLKIVK